MVLAWNLSFGVEIRFGRGIQVSPPRFGVGDVLGRSQEGAKIATCGYAMKETGACVKFLFQAA